MIGNGFCGIHGRYESTGGCPSCPLLPPVTIAAAPQVYPPLMWTGTTGGDAFMLTVFRERERFRDALTRIRRITDDADTPDLDEAFDQIGEVVCEALEMKSTPKEGT